MSLPAGHAEAVRFRSLGAGITGGAHIYLDSSNTAGVVLVGVYSDAGGRPGTLLSAGAILSPVAGAWNWAPITATSIAPSTNYWISVLGEDGTLSYRDHRQGACLSATSTQRALSSLSGSWGLASVHSECPISVFVTAAEPTLVSSSSSSSPPVSPPTSPPAAPGNTVLPVVSGTVTEGQTLSAGTGSWTGSPTAFAYQWQDCNGSGTGCSSIGGALGSTYKLASSDVEHTIRVVVTATNEGGSTSATSQATATVAAAPPPPPAAPSNTVLPAVSGITTEGQTLTAGAGTWTDSPTSFAYQWQDCDVLGEGCADIAGATSSGYTLHAGDVGHTVRVVLTATNAGGSTSADSLASAVVAAVPPPTPANVAMPSVSGKPMEGEVLQTTSGAWTGNPTSYAYQWRDCNALGHSCTNVSGATSPEYRLTTSDVSHTMKVMVTASNVSGSSSMSSPATATIEEPPVAPPTNSSSPTIGGEATEGKTLSATAGTWTGSPTSFSYQWQDCEASGEGCTDVVGATSTSYTLRASDVNDTVRVIVTASNGGGSAAAGSAVTGVVAAVPPPPPPLAPVNSALPTIGGTTTGGQTLSAGTGTWTGNPTSFAYQWQDCDGSGFNCADDSDATSAAYALSASDVGHTVRVVVTATNEGGSTSAASQATATVAAVPPPPPAAPVNTVSPTIGGTATEGQALSAGTGTWTGSPTAFGYQWQDCNGSGTGCSSIGGATGSTYKLASSDVEHTIRVVVTATNEGGSTSATSQATSKVGAIVVTTGCTSTISSGLSTAIKNAAAGSTICLSAGSYGEVSATVSKSSMVTVKPAGGVSQSQAVLGYVNVATSSNLTFEGLTIAGGNVGSSSSPATHIHWVGDAFTSGLCIQTPTSANIDILVEGSTFFNIAEGNGGCGNEGRLEVNGDNKGVSGTNGVVISHTSFGRNGCTDGVNITGGGSGTVIGPDDVFENMKEGSCKAHVDPIQFYGAKGTTVTGDYFHGNSDGIMSPDGNGSPMTVTNDVFDTDGEYPWQIVIGGGEHDVISHDTFGHGAMIRIGHVNVGATAANETITDNVLTGGFDLSEGQSSSGWTMEYNLVEAQTIGTHAINGKPTYVGGGSEPSTWAGWALTGSSLGHLAAGDGTDIGADQFGS